MFRSFFSLAMHWTWMHLLTNILVLVAAQLFLAESNAFFWSLLVSWAGVNHLVFEHYDFPFDPKSITGISGFVYALMACCIIKSCFHNWEFRGHALCLSIPSMLHMFYAANRELHGHDDFTIDLLHLFGAMTGASFCLAHSFLGSS